ncbi:trimethylamine methyltransferase family protein [Eubacteriaceae bacterium ES3]|nr:trimethylamine methyltransferase family protein [Eubacteriaceae bacterium ES3]
MIEGIKSYYEENKARYTTITESECETIISATLDVMERTAQIIGDPETLEILKQAGCPVDGKKVTIPRELVKKAIETAPSSFTFYNRNGEPALEVGGNNSYYGLGPTNPYFCDFETQERRTSVSDDTKNCMIVADYLSNIDFVMSLSGSNDGPANNAEVLEMKMMLENTTKPIVGWGNSPEGIEEIVEMCGAVAGSVEAYKEKPFVAIYVGDPVTPLQHPKDSLEKLLYCCKNNIPAIYLSDSQLGTLSPVTLAGSVVLGLAEILTGLVISQLVNEGCVYVGGVINLSVDMKPVNVCYGSPEFCLGNGACYDVLHYLNLPIWGTANITDSKFVDEQAAIEGSMTSLTSCLNGANLIHDAGFIEGAMSAALEQIVMSNEIISYARRVRAGMEINEETLALDLIDQVGAGGTYITELHTLKHFKEVWESTLFDHAIFDPEVKFTKMSERIKVRVSEILESHQPEKLAPETINKLDDIYKESLARMKRQKKN